MAKSNVAKGEQIVGSPCLHNAFMFVTMFAFWMILSGRTETKFIVYGIITAAAATWVTYPLLLVPNREGTKKYFVFGVNPIRFIKYFFWIMYQLWLANIDVLKATSSQELHINPRVVRFHFLTENPIAMVLLANSITLTPGTVTINVTEDGLYEIHALTTGAASGIISGDFPKAIAELYNEPCNFSCDEKEE